MNRSILSFCFAAILMVSCKKDNDFSSPDKIVVQLGTRHQFYGREKCVRCKIRVDKRTVIFHLPIKTGRCFLTWHLARYWKTKHHSLLTCIISMVIGINWFLMKSLVWNLEKSITIDYRGVEAVIKETDRPLGLYFVFYNDKKEEEKIVEVTELYMDPFHKAGTNQSEC